MAGKQKFKEDSIGALSKVNATTVELAASLITIGGLQYDTGTLSLSTLLTGVGGLDAGPVSNDTMYCVYAVLDAGEAAIIASTNLTAPSGYTVYKKVGAFLTSNSGDVSGTDLRFPVVKELLTSGTYTVPNGVKYLKISDVGGGGGGAGASNNGTNNANAGTTGSDTTFGSVFVAQGSVSNGTTSAGGIGGDVVILDTDNFVVLKTVKGGSGNIAHTVISAGGAIAGGKGGDSMLGVAKNAGIASASAADDNSGAGGRGGGTDYTANYYASPGGGGGAGGGVIGIIPKPEASYTYTIGAGGNGGTGQGGIYKNGGAGGSGKIIVEEYYE